MIQPAEIEQSLCAVLPAAQHTDVSQLACVLAEAANGGLPAETLQQRLAMEPAFQPLLQQLSGRTIELGKLRLSFSSQELLEQSVGGPSGNGTRNSVVIGSDTHVIDRRHGVAISGGFVEGVVVGFNAGAISYTKVTVNVDNGTRLDHAPRPAIVRCAPPQPPLPVLRFYDRAQPLNELQAALQPRHGAWLTGRLGCGVTALLRQAANRPEAKMFPDGILYVDGDSEPSEPDDIVQEIYSCFYKTETGEIVRPDPNTARTELGNLRALFLLDRLRLNANTLAALADTLAGSGAVLLAADGIPPASLFDISLGSLPNRDAVRLMTAEARVDADQPEVLALLGRLCAALDCLPLPLLLVARLLRMQVTTLAQLVAAAEAFLSEREPLVRAVRLVLMSLTTEEHLVLAALVHVGGPSANLEALVATSQLPYEIVEDVLARMLTLRLINVQDNRYTVSAQNLRRVLGRLLPQADERLRAATFFTGAAALHSGDLDWLSHEWRNLMAAGRTALTEGNAAEAGQLARAVQPHLVLNGLWSSWEKMINLADQAAQSSGDLALRAWGLHERGTHAGLQGDLSTAATHLSDAHRLRLDLGDRIGADATLHNMEYLGLLPPPAAPRDRGPLRKELKDLLPIHIPAWVLTILAALLLGVGIASMLMLSNPAPTAALSVRPTTGSYPLTVIFDASASSGRNAGDTLTYLWDFGDGTVLTSTQSLITHTYAVPGSYTAILRVRNNYDTLSSPTQAQVEVINAAPMPIIALPAATTRFQVGQSLTLRGSAADPEDGKLKDAALTWSVIVHHADHTHVLLPPTSGNSITFTAPAPENLDTAATSYLEIRLTATDSRGQTGVITEALRPDISKITFLTQPPGLRLLVNTNTITAPHTLDIWNNDTLQVSAPEQRDGSGLIMTFDTWSDGGAAAHTITATATAVYTATFKPLQIRFSALAFRASEGAGSAMITATLSVPSMESVTVDYATHDGTARERQDYTAVSGVLTFAPGETSKTFSVPIVDDMLDEPDETVIVSLRTSGGVTLDPEGTGTLTFQDDDPPPVISFRDVTPMVREDAGNATIAVALDVPSEQTVTVDYATSNGTALAGQDYASMKGTLTFAPGETSKTFNVPITNDRLSEANETIKLILDDPVNATFGDQASGRLTIQDDDPLPSVAFAQSNFSGKESADGVPITVVLSAKSGRAVSVAYTTKDNTADANSDYTTTNGTLTFAPGETSKTFNVLIKGDSYFEADETVSLVLSDPQGTVLGTPTMATLTIQNDDKPPTVQFSSAEYRANENDGTATITVNLSAPSGILISVRYATADGTAKAGQDYAATSGTLTFNPGETSKTIPIPINNNTIDEPDRALQLVLSDPSIATLGGSAAATLTIVDDDVPTVQFSSADYQANETHISDPDNPSSNSALITVVLSAPSWQPVTVDVASGGGTATVGQDYTPVKVTLTFAPGETSKTFSVQIINDAITEPNETVKLTLSHPVNTLLATSARATLTILDDDQDTTPPVFGAITDTSNQLLFGDGACPPSPLLTVQGQVSDPSGVRSVTLNYRFSNQAAVGGWRTRIMQVDTGGGYFLEFDALAEALQDLGRLQRQNIIEYYLDAIDNYGNTASSSLQTSQFNSTVC